MWTDSLTLDLAPPSEKLAGAALHWLLEEDHFISFTQYNLPMLVFASFGHPLIVFFPSVMMERGDDTHCLLVACTSILYCVCYDPPQ